jgi:hypothetical protein
VSKSGGFRWDRQKKVKTWGKSTQIHGEASAVRPTAGALPPRGAETAAQSLSQGIGHGKPTGYRKHGLLRRIAAISCDSVRRVRYLFIIKAILKDSKVVVCWIVKAFARTSASSS